MYIDLVHSVGGSPQMIFDAKYKVSRSDGRYPNADHYQMLAYCTALKVPERGWSTRRAASDPLSGAL